MFIENVKWCLLRNVLYNTCLKIVNAPSFIGHGLPIHIYDIYLSSLRVIRTTIIIWHFRYNNPITYHFFVFFKPRPSNALLLVDNVFKFSIMQTTFNRFTFEIFKSLYYILDWCSIIRTYSVSEFVYLYVKYYIFTLKTLDIDMKYFFVIQLSSLENWEHTTWSLRYVIQYAKINTFLSMKSMILYTNNKAIHIF